jgi:hypothetical protein
MKIVHVIYAWAVVAFLVGEVTAESAKDRPSSNSRRQDMAERIDELIAERWKDEGVSPAPVTSDAEFFRRACLDLTGIIPRIPEVRAFLADASDEKRVRLVERLVSSPAHASHLAKTWRRALLPDAMEPARLVNSLGLEEWLRQQFANNLRYDRIVSDLLVTTGGRDSNPSAFFSALDLQPEKLAARTARVFLGLQVECAQCHEHPYEDWTQEDFWGFAAFFARLSQQEGTRPGEVRLVDLDDGEVRHPYTGAVISPKFLHGPKTDEQASGSRRVQLAIWMASRDNPYLARAAVNRAWAQLFGRGLVDPIDDLGPHNPPSHPQLLEELSTYFVETGFDMRELFHTLALTRAYQLTSRTTGDSPPPPELFARMAVKTLSADQLYDSLWRVGLRKVTTKQPNVCSVEPPERQLFTVSMQMRGQNAQHFEAGLLQSLAMLNGMQVSRVTNRDESNLLTSLAAPFFTDAERVEMLFLGTLGRRPTAEEDVLFTSYLRAGGESGTAQDATADALWALLNSAEFMLNH